MFYAIRDIDEAAAYLAHPTLGQRLVACTEAVNAHTKRTAERIFGCPDYLKFRSCMTLFEKTSRQGHPFTDAIEQFFDGERDARTLRILAELSKTRQG